MVALGNSVPIHDDTTARFHTSNQRLSKPSTTAAHTPYIEWHGQSELIALLSMLVAHACWVLVVARPIVVPDV